MKLRNGLQWFFRPTDGPTPQINTRNTPNRCLPTKYGDYTAQFLTDLNPLTPGNYLNAQPGSSLPGVKQPRRVVDSPLPPRLKSGAIPLLRP
jgi:hypothetical protein